MNKTVGVLLATFVFSGCVAVEQHFGRFTPDELSEIRRVVRSRDREPFVSITREPDGSVTVETGQFDGHNGSGSSYHLRFIKGAWIIVQESAWLT
jgi:hypothetical protein